MQRTPVEKKQLLIRLEEIQRIKSYYTMRSQSNFDENETKELLDGIS